MLLSALVTVQAVMVFFFNVLRQRYQKLETENVSQGRQLTKLQKRYSFLVGVLSSTAACTTANCPYRGLMAELRKELIDDEDDADYETHHRIISPP